ncbi:GPW/gp25 family protein [Yersinia mollaretii]|uniref:GPW/gp25 family protein n=1 Tax=Yersinia mollaretii TaxID=33060 RepID=UPI00119C9873|nr:GPW/gp25 family protein [Yersinia mollaretii]
MTTKRAVVAAQDIRVNWSPSSVVEEVMQNVAMIISTAAGSVPYDRQLGISGDAIDAPPLVVRAAITREIIQKISRYEPRAIIHEISFVDSAYGETDIVVPKLIIGVKP